MSDYPPSFAAALHAIADHTVTRSQQITSVSPTASRARLDDALLYLPQALSQQGLGFDETVRVLRERVGPALAPGQAGPRYYGFVVGGVAPAAHVADHLVTAYDSNVQVNLHQETIATWVEDQTLQQLCQLFGLDPTQYPSRTLTTGATASNILGLAMGREHALKQIKGQDWSVAEEGFGGVDIKVFCAGAHASTVKAASVVGIGRSNCIEMMTEEADQPCAFHIDELEQALKGCKNKGQGAIVVASLGEVNTGGCTPQLDKVRSLCTTYGAWLHIDAAFGSFACLHPDFHHLTSDMTLADSITSDAHKWAQTPYDCGIFLAKGTLLPDICGPGSKRAPPAYLNAAAARLSDDTQTDPQLASLRTAFAQQRSPLHMNLENSRRFRALPLYANLISLGREGYQELVGRNIALARAVEQWLRASSDWDVLTPLASSESSNNNDFKVMNIVLFAPSKTYSDQTLRRQDGAAEVVRRINAGGEVYVSGTSWRGRGALRMAVSNWMTTLDRDLPIVIAALQNAVKP